MERNQLKHMDIAIVHDSLTEAGGAERVLEEMFNVFPQAHLYTSFVKNIPQLRSFHTLVKRSWKGIPLISKFKTISKLFVHHYWESLDLSHYQVVISSSDVFSSKSVLTRPSSLHICYCHTPPKFLYPEYPSVDETRKNIRFRTQVLLSFLRAYDYIAAQRPDKFVTNSETVKARIKKYYRRDATVIYPPVAIPPHGPNKNSRGDYYVYIGKLQESKGVKLAIEACNELHRELVVIGEGRQVRELEKMAGPQIRLHGFVSEKVKIGYLKKAKGFIFPSRDEDFGIAPVEAMAYGIPVIAYFSGGPRETIVEGKTGLFIRTYSTDSLVDGILRFERMYFDPKDCHRQAAKYSKEIFREKFLKFIVDEYDKHQNNTR
jgi:glycosyltransferase involved in cell wall biosynthesis